MVHGVDLIWPCSYLEAIIKNQPIKVFNNGNMIRDFTYIDDIIEGVFRVIFKTATPNKTSKIKSKFIK